MTSDLHVNTISQALESFDIDVIVSGSIGAIESVRFIRSLRRIGASVYPWLTAGGSQFITKTALEWAANNSVITDFSGKVTHLATREACVVAPASANFIAKIANGITDTPQTALVASYLGMGKPVLIVPNMHDSLYQAPALQKNLRKISPWLKILQPRIEEGKKKFPKPNLLADAISHHINHIHKSNYPGILVSMGTTRGYVDEIRYFSNYSSGKLGTLISEELYRRGFTTHVVSGPCQYKPESFSRIEHVETNNQLEAACLKALEAGCGAAILAASVLDFIPSSTVKGKISSSSDLKVEFKKADKIISKIKPKAGIKVGFKLESSLTEQKALEIANQYFQKYDLSYMVLNPKSEVDSSQHFAYLAIKGEQNKPVIKTSLNSKEAIANSIADHISLSYRKVDRL